MYRFHALYGGDISILKVDSTPKCDELMLDCRRSFELFQLASRLCEGKLHLKLFFELPFLLSGC